MKYCPLMSFQKQYTSQVPCLEEECALAADGAGNCLIKQALQCYVAAERTRLFEKEADMTPEKDNTSSIEVQLRPPQVDGSYIHF